jgi:hypothetical protein
MTKGCWRCLFAVLVMLPSVGVMAASPFTIREESKKPLSEPVEKELRRFVDEGAPVKHEQLKAHMKLVIDAMRKSVPLSDEEARLLTEDADKIIADSIKTWRPASIACLRCYLVNLTDEKTRLRYVNQWTVTEVAENHSIEGWVLPDALPQWSDAVRARLDEARAKKWLDEATKAAANQKKQDRDYLERWAKMARVSMDEDLRVLIEDMKKQLSLSAEQVEKLAKEAVKLVDEHAEAEMQAGAELLASQTAAQRERTFGSRNAFITRFMKPKGSELEAQWAKIATQELGAEPVQRWTAAMEARKEEEVKDILESLKPMEQQSRSQMEILIATEVDGYCGALNLDDKRKAALEKLSKEALDASIAAARQTWEQTVRRWSAAERKSRRNVYFGVNESERPMKMEVWTRGLEQLFTAEETQRMKADVEARAARRKRALAQSALAEMDRTLALNQAQRTALEPLIIPLLEPLLKDENEEYWSFQPYQLLNACSKAEESAVRAILDDTQWTRWGTAVATSPQHYRRNDPLNPAPEEVSPEEAAKINVEEEISRHLHEMHQRERKTRQALMMARVEDARRVLALPEDKVKRLTIAAKGAVEDDLLSWRRNVENWVRGSVERATPESIKTALAGLDRSNYSAPGNGPEKSSTWRLTVASLLSPAELERWKKVIDERRAYRVDALASMSVNELDRRRRLTPEQHTQLKEKLAAVLVDYLPDIERYMTQAWHLQYYYCLLPLAGVKEEDLKKVFTERQWKLVQERDLPDSRQYWEGIENYHRRRLKGEDTEDDGGQMILDFQF